MASGKMYDSDIQTLYIVDAAGISLPGTAASDTELVRIPLNQPIKVETTARLTLSTGGTAAGPSLLIGKSAAGTGTVSQIGTSTPGTAADDTVHSFTLTQTDFAAGDVLVVSNAAGTADATPVIDAIVIDYKPDFD